MQTYNKSSMHDCFINVQQYIHLLPLNEKLVEINNMVKYYSKNRHSLHNFRQRFAVLRSLNEIKKDILSDLKNISIE